jgi:hypothetical protein
VGDGSATGDIGVGRRGLLGANGLSHQVDVAVMVRWGWE